MHMLRTGVSCRTATDRAPAPSGWASPVRSIRSVEIWPNSAFKSGRSATTSATARARSSGGYLLRHPAETPPLLLPDKIKKPSGQREAAGAGFLER